MKKLNEALNVFDLKQPTYKEITGIINKPKSVDLLVRMAKSAL